MYMHLPRYDQREEPSPRPTLFVREFSPGCARPDAAVRPGPSAAWTAHHPIHDSAGFVAGGRGFAGAAGRDSRYGFDDAYAHARDLETPEMDRDAPWKRRARAPAVVVGGGPSAARSRIVRLAKRAEPSALAIRG